MLKSVVIGAGRIALSHLPHIISHPSIELKAIVEPNFVTRNIIKKLTKVKTLKSLNQIDSVNYDCAFILTPPSSHYKIAKSLLEKGKHIFIEKPLTLNSDDSENLLRLAKEKNLNLSVGYVYRFHPIYQKLKKLLLNNNLGILEQCNSSMIGNVVSKKTSASWRNTGVGSGCLYDYGCHLIDLNLYLFGRPNFVKCISKEELFHEGVIDKFKARFQFDNFNSHVYCNWADNSVRKASISIEIQTSRNLISCDGQTIKVNGENSENISIKQLDTNVDYYLRGEEFQLQLEGFIKDIKKNSISYDVTEDAVLCDEYISRIYQENI